MSDTNPVVIPDRESAMNSTIEVTVQAKSPGGVTGSAPKSLKRKLDDYQLSIVGTHTYDAESLRIAEHMYSTGASDAVRCDLVAILEQDANSMMSCEVRRKALLEVRNLYVLNTILGNDRCERLMVRVLNRAQQDGKIQILYDVKPKMTKKPKVV
jgi:hypothetical protein